MKIMIVDDDDDIRFFVRLILENISHDIIEAENGQIAVELFSQVRPDLIVMDLMMPVMDGHAATKEIKKIVGDGFVPILFLTSKSDDSTLIQCLKNGGDDFISKPVNVDVFLAKIDSFARIINLHKTMHEKNESLIKINNLICQDQIESEKIYAKVLNRGYVDCACVRSYQKASDIFNGDVVMSVMKPGGNICFLIGDFTGHGLPAAICVLPVVDIFYQMSKDCFSIQDITAEINDKLNDFLPSDRFFATVIFDIDVIQKKLIICNAGMPDVLIFSKEAQVKNVVNSSCLPLGIVPNSELKIDYQELNLEEDDLILCSSDGVTETTSPEGESFGRRNLEQAVVSNNASVNAIDNVLKELIAFKANEEFDDDISLLSVKVDYEKMLAISSREIPVSENGDWQVSVRLDAKTLKEVDPVSAILSAVSAMRSNYNGKDTLNFLLTEMFSNAIEHGLLKLDSSLKQKVHGFELYYKEREKRLAALAEGFVKVTFTYAYSKTKNNSGQLTIEMEDSGDGFDVGQIVKNKTDEKEYALYNRGIGLIGNLSESLEYNEKGNRVKVSLQCSFAPVN